jgi:hypothetical protein
MKKIRILSITLVAGINRFFQSRRKISDCYITYAGGWDGACAQAHSIISILLFARKYNIGYIHSPIKNVEHFDGDRTEWSSKWENTFSLGYGEKTLEDIDLKTIKTRRVKYPFLIRKRENTLYLVSNCHSYTDKFAKGYKTITQSLRFKYWNFKEKINDGVEKKKLKICVHIRRGDVSESENSFRYTKNSYLTKKIEVVYKTILSFGLTPSLFIFSQGVRANFKEFERFDPKYYLNHDDFQTFNHLVEADILIMAKSSFSFVAALLNEKIVLYEPFWHSPLPGWINMKNSEASVENSLKKQLTHLKLK